MKFSANFLFALGFCLSCSNQKVDSAAPKSTPPSQVTNQNSNQYPSQRNDSTLNSPPLDSKVNAQPVNTVTHLVLEFLREPWRAGSANEYQTVLVIAEEGCYPAFINDPSCRDALRNFIAIKDANARGKASGQDLCAYNAGLKTKYQQIERDYCQNPGSIAVPNQMLPLSGHQYCKIGRVTSEILDARHAEFCQI